MLRKILCSFSLAWNNIRANFLHTFLSVLGIVIGVGALVSILSLIDGMEQFARDQIASTTNLNTINARSELFRQVNGVSIRKDSAAVLNYGQYVNLQHALSKPFKAFVRWSRAGEASFGRNHQVIGVNAIGTGPLIEPGAIASAGELLSGEDTDSRSPKALVNTAFLRAVNIHTPNDVLGQSLFFNAKEFRVTGVLAGERVKTPQIYFPITFLSRADLSESPPEVNFEAQHTEDVSVLKTEITSWLKSHYPHADDFKVSTNEFRVDQTARGFLLFRVIMGLIVGISVVVGGIGVMNVLLISVTERTTEIGIRKAVGANRRDIILLFLSESITVAAFGSFLGVIFGVGSTMIIIPIVKALTKVPFQAAYTLNTFLIISIVSIAVGVIFGTYPAIRASRLNPVDAIRHE